MPSKINVFSVQMTWLGHRTYARLLRRGFADSDEIAFDSRWTNDDLELPVRIVNRILWQKIPIRPIWQRDLDLKRFRSDLGVSLLGRRLVDRAVKRQKIDVLHFHTQNCSWLSPAYMRNIPTVITTDQTDAQIARDYPSWTRWTHAPCIAMERRAVRAASAVVCFSQWAADSFLREYDIPHERVHVIPVGVDVDAFSGLKNERNNSTQERRILFVGGEYIRKGGPLLVDVFRRRFAHQNVELHLMSDDPNARAQAGGGIFVHDDVKPFSEKWFELFGTADIFVLPTLSEPYGIAYVEAMAAGLPVIGTRTAAAPEIVSEDAGFLVAPGNADELAARIQELLDNEDLRRSFGEHGRERARRLFASKSTVNQLGELFKSVSAERKRVHAPSLRVGAQRPSRS